MGAALAGWNGRRGHETAGPPRRPPGPSGDRWAGCLAEYERDRLGFLLWARDEYGGLVTFDGNTTVVNDPVLAKVVLGDSRRFATLGDFLNRRISPERAATKSDLRRHLNAGMRRAAAQDLAAASEAAATRVLTAAVGGRSHGSVAVVDPLPVLETALSKVITEFYFGDEFAAAVAGATNGLLDALSSIFGSPFALPARVPSPANLRVRRRYRRLRSIVDPLVLARMTGPGGSDFATGVARAASSSGHGLQAISDLLIGSLLAARRVPAAAASWALFDLASSPDWTAKSRSDPVCLGAAVTESCRLHPPTWILRRTATGPVDLGGYEFPTGQNFLVSPYVIHRDPPLFPDATSFNPERWLDNGSDSRDLLTFGRGIHRCPAVDASSLILVASLGAILRNFRIEDVSAAVQAKPRTTLTADGLRLCVSALAIDECDLTLCERGA